MENLSIPEALSKQRQKGNKHLFAQFSYFGNRRAAATAHQQSGRGWAGRLEPFANNKNSSSTNSTFWVNNLESDALSCRSLMLLFWATTPRKSRAKAKSAQQQ